MKREKMFGVLTISMIVMVLVIIPMLSVVLSTKYHISKMSKQGRTYENTKYSYFAPEHYTEEAQQVTKDIVKGIADADWDELMQPLTDIATNPGKALEVFEETFEISASELIQ